MKKFNRQRFMRNLNTARQCWGCKFLHIGREVDHNHCDRRGASSWMEKRVNNLVTDNECCLMEHKNSSESPYDL